MVDKTQKFYPSFFDISLEYKICYSCDHHVPRLKKEGRSAGEACSVNLFTEMKSDASGGHVSIPNTLLGKIVMRYQARIKLYIGENKLVDAEVRV